MLDFITNIIKETAELAGIQKDHVIERTNNSIIIPKPALSYEFMEEVVNKSGYNLAVKINKKEKNIKRVLSLYEVTLPIVCNLYADSKENIISISNAFIKNMPRKLADPNGNIVKIKVTSTKWEVIGGSQIGLKKIEPIVNKERLIKIDVIYHITNETYKPIFEKLLINGQVINKENSNE